MAKAGGFFHTAWRATFRPAALFSLPAPERSAVSPVLFAVGAGILGAMANLVWAALIGGVGKDFFVEGGWAVISPLTTLFGVYLTAALVHVALLMFRSAKQPFAETLSCVGYSRAPVLLSVVPILGPIVAPFWQLVVLAIALKRGQATTRWRAVGAVLLGSLVFGPFLFGGIALVIRVNALEAFKIPSGSMSPTVQIGDHIFVNKVAYGASLVSRKLFSSTAPARGEVVVFRFPENRDQDFIKRIIAVPGDTLEVLDGRPILNGVLAPNCYVGTYRQPGHDAELYVEYLQQYAYLTLYDAKPTQQQAADASECEPGTAWRAGLCGTLQGPYKVARGEVWVMGDNRNNSHDSRSWRAGMGAGVPFADIKGRAMSVWMSFGPGGGIVHERLSVEVMGPPVLSASQSPELRAALDACLAKRPATELTTPPSRTP